MADVGRKTHTKKWRMEKAREIIDRNKFHVSFSAADLREFADIIGVDIQDAVREPDPQFPYNTRHVLFLINGKWVAMSWRKRIQENSTPESEAKYVMRFTVSRDMAEFKRSAKPPECAYCGATDDITVDHVGVPFDDIAVAFMREHGVPDVVDSTEEGRIVKMFRDPDIEKRWTEFHTSMARYQILCRSCNASKGKA